MAAGTGELLTADEVSYFHSLSDQTVLRGRKSRANSANLSTNSAYHSRVPDETEWWGS
jgi:hypothetical protein